MRRSLHHAHDNNRGAATDTRLMRDLQKRGFKQTRQRRIILDVFQDMGGHPSPEEIHKEIQRRGYKLGLATIYRTLKALIEYGLVQKLEFGDGQTRYELWGHEEFHLHLICERCGKTLEAPAAAVNALFKKLARANTFTLRGHTTYLHGICSDCLSTSSPKNDIRTKGTTYEASDTR